MNFLEVCVSIICAASLEKYKQTTVVLLRGDGALHAWVFPCTLRQSGDKWGHSYVSVTVVVRKCSHQPAFRMVLTNAYKNVKTHRHFCTFRLDCAGHRLFRMWRITWFVVSHQQAYHYVYLFCQLSYMVPSPFLLTLDFFPVSRVFPFPTEELTHKSSITWKPPNLPPPNKNTWTPFLNQQMCAGSAQLLFMLSGELIHNIKHKRSLK